MKTKNKRQIFAIIASIFLSVSLVAVAVYATTTVGNDVTVGGALNVTATTTLSSTLLADGNVGIATSSPSYLLHVWGSAGFGTSATPLLFVNSTSSWVNISGSLTVTGTSSPAGSKIEMGTIDQVAYNRRQIWNSLPNSVLRLGALTSDGDAFNTTSEGIIVYGQNAVAGSMSSTDWGYARIKPDRYSLYSKEDGVYIGDIFRVDLSDDNFYLRDNSGNKVFDFLRATGRLYITGNMGIGTTTPATLLHVSKSSATTTATFGNGSGGSLACLKLRDSDDGGWTYCTVLDGAMNCTTTSCE